jgi:hypothetical protein
MVEFADFSATIAVAQLLDNLFLAHPRQLLARVALAVSVL